MSSGEPTPDLKALRRLLRARRRALRPAGQRAAARRLCRVVTRSMVFGRARRISLYLAADGEIDPAPLCREAWRRGKQVYLPVLHPLKQDHMVFRRFRDSDRLLRNRFGILEPATLAGSARPWQLDLVLMPLVAFDPAGNRLGMGGGFYDRTFAAGLQQRWPRRPTLCGLAHALQQVASLPGNPWDVPVQRVFTDRGTFSVRR